MTELQALIVELFGKLLAPVSGWKTYIGALGFILVAAYYTITLQGAEAWKAMAMAMVITGIRHAIAKATPAAPPEEPIPDVLPFDDQDLDEPRA